MQTDRLVSIRYQSTGVLFVDRPGILVIVVLLWSPASAQTALEHSAAASAAGIYFGGIVSAARANPALLAAARRSGFSLHLARPYQLPSLQYARAELTRAGSVMAAGVFVGRLGSDEFADLSSGLLLARSWRAGNHLAMRFGARIQHLRFAASNYPALSSMAAGLGWSVAVDSIASIGAHFEQAIFSRDGHGGYAYPARSQVDGTVQITETVAVGLRVTRDQGHSPGIGLGVTFLPASVLRLSTGVTTNPDQISWGFGILRARWDAHFGFVSHEHLGLSSSLTLGTSRRSRK